MRIYSATAAHLTPKTGLSPANASHTAGKYALINAELLTRELDLDLGLDATELVRRTRANHPIEVFGPVRCVRDDKLGAGARGGLTGRGGENATPHLHYALRPVHRPGDASG